MTLSAVLSSHDEKLSYFDALGIAMELLAHEQNAIFMGQGVAPQGGTTMSDTFKNVPSEKRLEMPVAEDMQMGMAIGMALGGFLPICVFPRWNFLLLAANQLINHLDRLPLYGGVSPKVIIRTAIPSTTPFNPGPQHDDDFTAAFASMCRTVKFVRVETAKAVLMAYQEALASPISTVIVEMTEMYKDARANA
jgi:2-oxoisovalerate dehydrogenase E1 component beta subunit